MLKRLFDIAVSFIGLAGTLPFYPFIALAIKLDTPGPVLYRQLRIGRYGRPFSILKFRTMVRQADQGRPIAIKGDNNITRVGGLLRRFEIDELPTLFNVLKGDMSIVGPRPEVPRYVKDYNSEQRRVLSVRPGMTDPGTLVFRNETDLLAAQDRAEETYLKEILPRKLQLNLQYVDKCSLLMDVTIIFRTMAQIVWQRKG